METRSLRIDKNWAANLNFDITVSDRIIGTDYITHPVSAPRQKPKADPMADGRRESHRSHVTFIALC
jgi:hypothetical protein